MRVFVHINTAFDIQFLIHTINITFIYCCLSPIHDMTSWYLAIIKRGASILSVWPTIDVAPYIQKCSVSLDYNQ